MLQLKAVGELGRMAISICRSRDDAGDYSSPRLHHRSQSRSQRAAAVLQLLLKRRRSALSIFAYVPASSSTMFAQMRKTLQSTNRAVCCCHASRTRSEDHSGRLNTHAPSTEREAKKAGVKAKAKSALTKSASFANQVQDNAFRFYTRVCVSGRNKLGLH